MISLTNVPFIIVHEENAFLGHKRFLLAAVLKRSFFILKLFIFSAILTQNQ